MNYFQLATYQSLILFVFYRLGQCQEFEYGLKLDHLSIYGTEQSSWEPAFLFKSKFSDVFIFKDKELNPIGDGEFAPYNVEIVEIFSKVFRFSLIRGSSQSYVNMSFTEKSSVQKFFKDIRSPAMELHSRLVIEKLFQYEIPDEDEENSPELLQLISYDVVFHSKLLNDYWFPNLKSFYFVSEPDAVHLVLLSKSFNVNLKLGTNIIVVCTQNISTHRFIVRFRRSVNAKCLFESIKDSLNPNIPCDIKWIPEGREFLQIITSR